MKTMKKFLSMAALAMVGAMTTGCSNEDDSIIDTTQQPEVIKSNVVTLTTTVGLDGAAATRTLTSTGVKTFAVGETMAVIYNNGTSTVKAVSHALEVSDITDGGKKATFTFDLETPNKSADVTYIYPAAMVKDDGTVNYSALNSQDGTLASLADNLDYCTKSGAWDGDNLPTLTLENQLAILAVTLKNEAGTSDITGSTTMLTVSDGSNTYNVTRSATEGPIYVAIRPTTSATIDITATSGGKGYYKTLTTTKSYAASNGYSVSWKMTQGANLSKLTADYTAQDGDVLTGTLGSNVEISIADGATVTLKDVTINGVNNDSYEWAGITCVGDATINLEGTNSVKGFYEIYPGIYVPVDKTLTIDGTGSLTANGGGSGAGIGGGQGFDCGNIEIKGGEITADGGSSSSGSAGIGGGGFASCGNITISGGTVTANGGDYGAGIGGQYYGVCGIITISGGTVTANGGDYGAGIGGGQYGICGNITISGGTVTATAGNGDGVQSVIGVGNEGTCSKVTITTGITSLTMTSGNGTGIVSDFIKATAVYANSTDITTMLSTSVTNATVTTGMTAAGFATSYNEGTKTWTVTKK